MSDAEARKKRRRRIGAVLAALFLAVLALLLLRGCGVWGSPGKAPGGTKAASALPSGFTAEKFREAAARSRGIPAPYHEYYERRKKLEDERRGLWACPFGDDTVWFNVDFDAQGRVAGAQVMLWDSVHLPYRLALEAGGRIVWERTLRPGEKIDWPELAAALERRQRPRLTVTPEGVPDALACSAVWEWEWAEPGKPVDWSRFAVKKIDCPGERPLPENWQEMLAAETASSERGTPGISREDARRMEEVYLALKERAAQAGLPAPDEFWFYREAARAASLPEYKAVCGTGSRDGAQYLHAAFFHVAFWAERPYRFELLDRDGNVAAAYTLLPGQRGAVYHAGRFGRHAEEAAEGARRSGNDLAEVWRGQAEWTSIRAVPVD